MAQGPAASSGSAARAGSPSAWLRKMPAASSTAGWAWIKLRGAAGTSPRGTTRWRGSLGSRGATPAMARRGGSWRSQQAEHAQRFSNCRERPRAIRTVFAPLPHTRGGKTVTSPTRRRRQASQLLQDRSPLGFKQVSEQDVQRRHGQRDRDHQAAETHKQHLQRSDCIHNSHPLTNAASAAEMAHAFCKTSSEWNSRRRQSLDFDAPEQARQFALSFDPPTWGCSKAAVPCLLRA